MRGRPPVSATRSYTAALSFGVVRVVRVGSWESPLPPSPQRTFPLVFNNLVDGSAAANGVRAPRIRLGRPGLPSLCCRFHAPAAPLTLVRRVENRHATCRYRRPALARRVLRLRLTDGERDDSQTNLVAQLESVLGASRRAGHWIGPLQATVALQDHGCVRVMAHVSPS